MLRSAWQAVGARQRPAPAVTGPVYRELLEVCADPQAYLGQTVRVRFQYESELVDWNPYLTRFGAEDFRAHRVWADDQFLWERDAWENPATTVFARRGAIAEEVLNGAPKLARFEAVAHVRQVFLGRPWIELEQVQRIHGEIGEGSLIHATRALDQVEKQQWRSALDNFDRALVGDMPDVARAELRRLREEARKALESR